MTEFVFPTSKEAGHPSLAGIVHGHLELERTLYVKEVRID